MHSFVTQLTSGLILAAVLPVFGQTTNPIEPKAGTWKTWAITSGKDFRVPPPPDAAATQAELERFEPLSRKRIPAFWTRSTSGTPARRVTAGLT